MNYLEWCGLFECGNQTIDSEHKRLFEIANEFYRKTKENETHERIYETLNRLIKYAEDHFKSEEKIFTNYGIDEEELQNHKELHEDLIVRIFELNEFYSKNKRKGLSDITKFIQDWLVLHVLIEDKKHQHLFQDKL